MKILLVNELFWLTLTVIMTSLFWVPYILNRMKEQGVWNASYDPNGEAKASAEWANRMMQAHVNAVENLVIFLALVLVLHAQGISTDETVAACAIYFFMRLLHYVVFTLGIPFLRVVTFQIGFLCQLYISLVLLHVM